MTPFRSADLGAGCGVLVTAYLVLPPLYSVFQTSLFTTKLTGELDEFTLSYYQDMFRELQVLGPFLTPSISRSAARRSPRFWAAGRLDCNAHRLAAARFGIFDRFCLLRHTVYFVHHRLAADSWQSWAGQ